MPGDQELAITLTYDILLLDTIKKMRDYFVADEQEKYYRNFEVAIQLVMPHLDIEIRKAVEADFKKLRLEEARIKESEKNPTTRTNALTAIRFDFATAHRYYVMLALTKVGIVKASEEGLIDFNSVEVESMKRVIRSGGGLPSALARAGIGDKEAKDAPALPNTEKFKEALKAPGG